ncbi:MAG TPA: MFS transporter, partial [Ilumatobacteraceae bacterium]|nr:MFS transporter [Ilumatobacteraceae bacterium]
MSEVARGRRESLAGVLRHPDLRRLSAGWASFFLVDALSVVAVSVWAFDRGGTTAVGVVGLLRLLPAGMAGPFGAWMADRYSRRAVMVASFAGMVIIQGALSVTLGIDAPVGVAYTLVALGGIVATAYRPAQLAVVPLVVRSPDELVAVNVTTGLVEGAVTFAGPALAAVLLAIASPTAVAGAASIAALLGLLAVAGLRVSSDPSRAVRRRPDSPIKAISAGFSELRAQPDVGILIGAGAVQILVRGMLMVLLVPVAIDLLDLENSAVGWLAAAMGIGGIIGALLATSLAGRRRLAMPFAMSLVLWGTPIAVIGIAPH